MFDLFKSNRPSKRDLPPEHREQPDPPPKRSRPLSIHQKLTRRVSKFFERDHERDRARDREHEQEPIPAPNPELEKLQHEVDQRRAEEQGSQETVSQLDAEIAKLNQKAKDRANNRSELERVTKELAVAQRFLSTADSLSQAEVVRAMEALNEEIFQLTSIVADKVQVTERVLQEGDRQEMFRKKIQSVGPLAAFLQVVEPQQLEDSLAIQIGWQAMLVQWCATIIQAWVVEDVDVGDLNECLNGMYAKITSQNDQAVAGRWRALCYGGPNDISSEVREKLPISVIQALAALPTMLGYISSKDVHDDLATEFQQRMEPLLDKCLKFRKMVGEGITSTDIRPYLITSGESFDPSSGDLEYEDEEPEVAKEKRGVIACSLGLGLYVTRTSPGVDGKFVEKQEPILKSKVVLQETLREIIA